MLVQYNVLIIGAGRIGALFDNPLSDKVFTHANAFSQDKRFNLLGFVDSDEQRAKKAAQIWNCKFFTNIKEAFDSTKIDVVCVAVPDEYHYDVLKELSIFPIKFVFAEKPLTKTLDQAVEIIELYNKKSIPISVNYTRRFVPEFVQIKEKIKNGDFGTFIAGNAYYGKGFLHNGSHLIDLLRYFLGEIKRSKIVSRQIDFCKDDPSISAILTLSEDKSFFVQNVDSNLFTIFEVDLLFEKKRIRVVDSGFNVEMYDVQESKFFSGYKNIVKQQTINTSLDKALLFAVNNIGNYLEGLEPLVYMAEDALCTMKSCFKILAEDF